MKRATCLASCFLPLDAHNSRWWKQFQDELARCGMELVLLSAGLPEERELRTIQIPLFLHQYRRNYVVPPEPVTMEPALAEALARRDRAWVEAEHLDLQAFRAGLATCQHVLRTILCELQPAVVLVWGNSLPQSVVLQQLALQQGRPCWIIERGLLPGTLMIEMGGQSGQAELNWSFAVNRAWQDSQGTELFFAAQAALRQNLQTKYPQAAPLQPDAFHQRYNPQRRQLIAFVLQYDPASCLVPNDYPGARVHAPGFRSSEEAICALAEAARPLDATIIVKPHPIDHRDYSALENDRVRVVRDVNLHSLMAAADVVACMTSTTQFEALLYEKPILLLARSQLVGKNVAYEALTPEELPEALRAALDRRDHQARLHNARRFIHFVLRHYSVAISESSPAGATLADLARFLSHNTLRLADAPASEDGLTALARAFDSWQRPAAQPLKAPGPEPSGPAGGPSTALSNSGSANRSTCPTPTRLAPPTRTRPLMQENLCLASHVLPWTPFMREVWVELDRQLDECGSRLVLLSTTTPESPLPFPLIPIPALLRDYTIAFPGACGNAGLSAGDQALLELEDLRAGRGASPYTARLGLFACRNLLATILNTLQPGCVLTWDAGSSTALVLQSLCRVFGIPVQSLDHGLLPETLMVESCGLQGFSDLSSHWLTHGQPLPALEAAYQRVRAYYRPATAKESACAEGGVNGNALRQSLELEGKRIIAFLGHFDAGGAPSKRGRQRRSRSSAFASIHEALIALWRLVENTPGTALVFKPHPQDQDPYAVAKVEGVQVVRDVEVHALLEAADVVAAQHSAWQYEAALYEKPVLLLGRSAWWGRKATYEVGQPDDLPRMLEAALQRRDWATRQANAHAFVAWAMDQFLIGCTPQVPTRRHLREFARYLAETSLSTVGLAPVESRWHDCEAALEKLRKPSTEAIAVATEGATVSPRAPLVVGLVLATRFDKGYSHSFGPLGLGYLAASIRRHLPGVNVVMKERLEELLAARPDIVGISAQTENYAVAIRYAQRVKAELKVPVVLGGVHVTMLPESMHEVFDVGVLGEGEVTFVELLRSFLQHHGLQPRALKAIPGLVFRDDGHLYRTPPREPVKDLDALAPPVLEELPFYQKSHMVCLVSARGCPYHCTFCVSEKFSQRYRSLTVERVADDVEEWVRRKGVTHVVFYDDLLIANKKRVHGLIARLREKSILGRCTFSCAVRANLVDEETCRLLKELGVTDVGMGAESFSDRILEYYNKSGCSGAINQRAIDLLHATGIKVNPSFIFGAPIETRDDMLITFRKVFQNLRDGKIHGPTWSGLIPYPGTKIWDYALQRGIVSLDMDWDKFSSKVHSTLYMCEQVSQAEFKELLAEWLTKITLLVQDTPGRGGTFVIRDRQQVAHHVNQLAPMIRRRGATELGDELILAHAGQHLAAAA